MVRHFRRHGSASSNSGYVAAKMHEVTGTFGIPLELCVSSTFSPVCVNFANFSSVHLSVCFNRYRVLFILNVLNVLNV